MWDRSTSTHVYSINAMHESVQEIPTFPKGLVTYDQQDKAFSIKGLGEALVDCYDKWKLPSDTNIDWSQRGKKIEFM